jgi:hypothetical protein
VTFSVLYVVCESRDQRWVDASSDLLVDGRAEYNAPKDEHTIPTVQVCSGTRFDQRAGHQLLGLYLLHSSVMSPPPPPLHSISDVAPKVVAPSVDSRVTNAYRATKPSNSHNLFIDMTRSPARSRIQSSGRRGRVMGS